MNMKLVPKRIQKLVPTAVSPTATDNIFLEPRTSLSVPCRFLTNIHFRTLYEHVGAFPPDCPEHPNFFCCATKESWEEIQDLNQVGPGSLWFLYSISRNIANDRKTRMNKSKWTGLFAIARGLVSHAISESWGEPYRTWKRFEDRKL
jgi:hypothetical protein